MPGYGKFWRVCVCVCVRACVEVAVYVCKHVMCELGTVQMGQELVLSWDCGGECLPPASLSMRPADLFIVASDGFHKPNGTDTPLMI